MLLFLEALQAAALGTMSMVIGGDVTTYNAVYPILESNEHNACSTWVGVVQGTSRKIANNMLAAAHNLSNQSTEKH